MTNTQKIGLVTFGLFMTEAIIHYNMGKKEVKTDLKENASFLPDTKNLIKIAVIVGAFSYLNGVILSK